MTAEPVGESAPVGRALMLTQQEWDDLCAMLASFDEQGRWLDEYDEHELSAYGRKMRRQRALAERIIEANQ